ncbi:sulfatase-like hydrolase/transferase [Myroides guanonis]|uniref:Glycosyltransferase, catalytic subunit of cellulose synthase and poly-beta-1,6-N-acetylglucosamine synthase n=1 Tax=Myroides guanonis TaxID=1150112 RepID=A0A1I3R276_9FLAO|nr:sulfatase-like hydrolase/transferase [Myroides guanonis]SFJ39862.1 Glycosyltransferase, catalytic subunit of cellulose synthase and poly-beta-1,6-N-acetylglucosamine synthase [Myroides guanonis]
MVGFAHILYEIFIWLFLVYSSAVFLIYVWIGIYALGAVVRYKKENTFTDYSKIAVNPNGPVFSLIAPAYNEGMTIVDNVRSLLSLFYYNLEIIIVNDGSKDDSMQKLIEVYELEVVSFFVQGKLKTKDIKAVYKSKNPAFKKLIVVDKFNGGKADALNVGINVSSGQYIVCIDVDCILEQDAILKLAKPFLQQTDKRVIACGGVIRLANNCVIENGKITSVNIPKTWLGRSQALEYIRAFVLGRMAWSRASGLILISGAFGAFDKEIVLKCGGYDSSTVGEDMELVVRMRRYMEDKKEAYEVVNIPDPLCWTEVPETKEVLMKQRNRWMRGTMETLWKHRELIFKRKYGKLGMISFPYWFFFEFLGPLVEFFGYIVFLLFLVLGIINWSFFLVLFALVISIGILYSIYAILVDLISHQVYTKRKDFLILIATAVFEPFYFHFIVVKASVGGFIDYFKKSTAWGDMTRQGFAQNTKGLNRKERIVAIGKYALQSFGSFALVFTMLFAIAVLAEWLWYMHVFGEMNLAVIGKNLLFQNFTFVIKTLLIGGILFIVLNFLKEKWARITIQIVGTLLVVGHYILFIYFSESNNLLGADLFYYSKNELQQILQAGDMLNFQNIALLVLLFMIVYIPFWLADKYRLKSIYTSVILLGIGFLAFLIPDTILSKSFGEINEFELNAGKSKWSYFAESSSVDFVQNQSFIAEFTGLFKGDTKEDSSTNKNYPFLKKENTPDLLGSYFNKSDVTPNLVVIVVEGLGHAYSSKNGYIGNFTPFIDSLAGRSLYWENNVSSSGRTFAVLPTLLGSLPFGKNGFLEMKETADHFNLYNVLKANGFETGYFYGGNVSFDNAKPFLKYSQVDSIIGVESFGPPYRKLPESNGESWGYEDQAVFGKMMEVKDVQKEPYFNVALTLSTHHPFLINDTKHFEEIFQRRVKSNELSDDQRKWALENKKQLVSVLNLDEALKDFFKEYKKHPDFKNTIIVITGDHSMPEIPFETKIDRYHVPLIIYSPLLKQNKHFRNIVSHFDIAPSVLAFYRENYGLITPTNVTWIGNGLQIDERDNRVGIPIMQAKTILNDYIYGNYHLVGDQVFKLDNRLSEENVEDELELNRLKTNFEKFKKRNAVFYEQKKLMPDSIYNSYKKINIPKP